MRNKLELVFSNDLCSAYLFEIARSFEKHHPNHYLGRTAVQKLAYFAQALGVQIPCSFEIYNYGPYSDEVKFAIDSLLADDVLIDKSASGKYSNYRTAVSSYKFDKSLQEVVDTSKGKIDKVVRVLGAFRPEQLELIATLHFIATRRQSLFGRKPKRDEVLKEFYKIKGDKFPDNDVSSWYDSLEASKLI